MNREMLTLTNPQVFAGKGPTQPGGAGRRCARFLLLVLAVAIAFVLTVQCGASRSAAVLPAPAAGAVADDPSKTKPWLSTLDDATDEARRLRQPIFVEVGAKWCGWCRKLEEELRKPGVQQELKRWTILRLDVDQDKTESKKLAVGGVPALRVLSPTGQVIASRDGYLPADELIKWLGQQHELVQILPLEGLTEDRLPNAETLTRLMKALHSSDATMREAAIRRLLRYPASAAGTVVDAFGQGDLATRLAVLEMLHEWQAPIDGLDPWQPETINEARLAELKQWAAGVAERAAAQTQPAPPSPADLAAAHSEIDALLAADTQVATDAVRERLARLGRALLPEVYDRLKAAATDRDRERLTTLRYRLVATDELALSWPGGLDRLAATDAEVRHRAASELAQRAKSADGPLLLELFSDPDPLVREISLRVLRSVGGSEATDALVGLLRDPEPNVRAAVLKELAENPSARLVPELAQYVETEHDPDLVVHAVRAFRGTGGDGALGALMKLLDHTSWNVRAEAAEALGEVVRGRGDISSERKADAYAALIRRLDDEDPFVVARAIKALAGTDLGAAVEPLVRAAVRHPEIAEEALAPLRSRKLRDKAEKPLRELIRHEDPRVRAAGIAAISTFAIEGVEDLLPAALADSSPAVRLAAARSVFTLINKQRPAEWGAFTISPSNMPDEINLESFRANRASQPTSEGVGAWVSRFRKGEGRPEWMAKAISPLAAMLGEAANDERLAAALPLVALGREDIALPAVEEMVRADPELVTATAPALAWLPMEPRRGLFVLLTDLSPDAAHLSSIARAVASTPDDGSAELLWGLLGRAAAFSTALGTGHEGHAASSRSTMDTSPALAADGSGAENGLASAAREGLERVYFGEWSRDPSRVSSAARGRIVGAARPRAQAGPPLQRVMALSLLLMADSDAAAEVCRGALAESETSRELRRAILQVLLAAQSTSDAERAAAESLHSDDAAVRKLALRYLAMGPPALSLLRVDGSDITLSSRTISAGRTWTPGEKIVPKAPVGLKADQIRPLLDERDGESAACAAYLLTLLGDRSGLERLIVYWRVRGQGLLAVGADDREWKRLAYRAIAALNDDAQTPVLAEIYEKLDRYGLELREFYWTVRVMDGPEILKLRKRIRDEVGMDALR